MRECPGGRTIFTAVNAGLKLTHLSVGSALENDAIDVVDGARSQPIASMVIVATNHTEEPSTCKLSRSAWISPRTCSRLSSCGGNCGAARDRVTLRHRGSDSVTTKRRSNIRFGRFHCFRSAGAQDRASDQVGSRTGPAEPVALPGGLVPKFIDCRPSKKYCTGLWNNCDISHEPARHRNGLPRAR
jgi:hypothetical protein